MQRIFNCTKIQDTSLIAHKLLNILIHGSLAYLSFYHRCELQTFKNGPLVQFFCPSGRYILNAVYNICQCHELSGFLLNLAVTTRVPSTCTVGHGCTAADTG